MFNEMMENENFVALDDEALEIVTGGKTRYIQGDDGKSHIRTGPARSYSSIGVLRRGDEVKYLGRTSVDERGVVWYAIRYNGRDAWVSSMYTRKVTH